MKIYHEIDPITKLFLTDVFYEELKDATGKITNPITANMISEPITQSLFHPKWDGTKWVEGKVAEGAVMKARIDYQARNKAILDQIAMLEQSIDTSRIRREYAEGMRKTLTGLSPTADELWSINKVQDVDSQIGILRAELN